MLPGQELAVEFREAGASDERRVRGRGRDAAGAVGRVGQGRDRKSLLIPGETPLNSASQALPPLEVSDLILPAWWDWASLFSFPVMPCLALTQHIVYCKHFFMYLSLLPTRPPSRARASCCCLG